MAEISIHHPMIADLREFDNFNVIEISSSGGGIVKVFTDGDWVEWDRLVATVAQVRESRRVLAEMAS